MKKMWVVMSALAGLALCLSGVSFSQTQVTEEWRAWYTGTQGHDNKASRIAVDASGNTYVTGTSPGLHSDGTYQNDILTVKYDTYGNQQWAARYQAPGWVDGDARGVDIAVAPNGDVYVVGDAAWRHSGDWTDRDIVVLRYRSTDGAQLNENHYSYNDNQDDYLIANAAALALDSQGNVYVTGSTSIAPNCTDYGWATIAYTSNLTQRWRDMFSHSTSLNTEGGVDIGVDNVGQFVYVTGLVDDPNGNDWATLQYYGSGGRIREMYHSGSPAALAVDASQNVIVTGTVQNPQRCATIKYNTNGGTVWEHDQTDAGQSGGVDVAVDASGDVIIAGVYASTYYYMLVEKYLSTNGSTIWSEKFQTSSPNTHAQALTLDQFGDVYVSGEDELQEYATVKYKHDTQTGAPPIWSITSPGGNSTVWSQDNAVDLAGNVYVTGFGNNYGTSLDYFTVKYNQGFVGFLSDSSNGRHLLRDPGTGNFHLVIRSVDNKVYYTRSTNNGSSWDGLTFLGNGKYPSIGMAFPPEYPQQAVPCVAYQPYPTSNYLKYKYLPPGTGGWQDGTIPTYYNNPGPPSLVVVSNTVTPGARVYVAYRAGTGYVYCQNFPYNTPATYVREVMDNTPTHTDCAQPCLAAAGNGLVYGAWRWVTNNQVWFGERGSSSPYWSPTNRLQVDWTSHTSQQPFVECYGDSVFVAWSDGQPSPSDVWRAAAKTHIPPYPWQYTNVSLIQGGSPVSESPTQAWREFTTWSEGTGSSMFDIYYWKNGQTGDLSNNPSEWSYWTHSQMKYPDPEQFTSLWSAWTESPNPGQPPYRVLTSRRIFMSLNFDPGKGSELSDYGCYYKVLAGQDTASEYCVKRDGVLRFADKAVDFARDSLVYELPYLDPVYDYYIRVASYREAGSDWVQGVSVNGDPTRTVRFAPNQVDTAWVRIPPEAYAQDRKVTFSLKNVKGDYVPALGLTLFQRDPQRGKGGPQSGEPVPMPYREVFAVFPNPLNAQGQVEYSLKAPGEVRLAVYDVMGRLVRQIVNDRKPAGVHKAAWDGKNANGKLVSSGVYFMKLSSQGLNKTARFVVVR